MGNYISVRERQNELISRIIELYDLKKTRDGYEIKKYPGVVVGPDWYYPRYKSYMFYIFISNRDEQKPLLLTLESVLKNKDLILRIVKECYKIYAKI